MEGKANSTGYDLRGDGSPRWALCGLDVFVPMNTDMNMVKDTVNEARPWETPLPKRFYWHSVALLCVDGDCDL